MGITKEEIRKIIEDLEVKEKSLSEEEYKEEAMMAMGFAASKMLDGYIEQDPSDQRISFLKAMHVASCLLDQLPLGGPRIGCYETLVICCSALAWKIVTGDDDFCFPGSGHVPFNTLGESIASAIAAARFSQAAREINSGHLDEWMTPPSSPMDAEIAIKFLGEKPADVFED